jgi:hypothetical protein
MQKYLAQWLTEIARKNMKNRDLRTDTVMPDDIWNAAQNVYYDAPELLEFVKIFLDK